MEHLVVSEITRHGYLAIFFLMVLESTCIPVPSEAVMMFGGALSAGITVAGVTSHLNIFAVAILGALGNIVGAFIAYWVGRTGGRTLVEKWGKYVLLRHQDLDRAEAYFNKRGEWAVLISRVLPVVRTFISFPAGVAEMPQFKFGIFTLLGSIPWTFGLAYLGRVLAGNWQNVTKYFTPISILFAIIIIAFIVRWYMKRRTIVMTEKAQNQ